MRLTRFEVLEGVSRRKDTKKEGGSGVGAVLKWGKTSSSGTTPNVEAFMLEETKGILLVMKKFHGQGKGNRGVQYQPSNKRRVSSTT